MAYPTHLAATLSGASLRQLQYWRESGLLAPELVRTGNRLLYSFRDVVALRTCVYLREDRTLQAIRKAIDTLRDLGSVEHLAAYRLIKTDKDILLVGSDEEPVSLAERPGHHRFTVVLGDTFQQFVNMQGASVVNLSRPRKHLAVDPETLGGYPVIAGSRVQFDQVASLIADGVPPGEVRSFYPAVSAAAARDAAQFARLVERFRLGELPSAA